MAIKISAWGGGFAAILGAGAILLAALQNKNWPIFLFAAIFIFLISTFSKRNK
jgi:hypothetical protein